MNITLTAAEAFAIKAAAPYRRDLRTIAARITADAIAAERRAESRAGGAEQPEPAACKACPYARRV